MNTPAKAVSGLIKVMVLSAVSAWLSAAGAQLQDPAPSQKKARLAVGEFRKLSGQTRFNLLQQGIPAVLQVTLLPYDELELIGQDKLQAKLDEMGLPARERTLQKLFQIDVLKAAGVDYLLKGQFIELFGKLLLSGVLVDVKSGREVRIGSVPVDEKKIVSGIESFAASAVLALKQGGVNTYARLFAVSCFEDRSSPASAEGKFAKRDLATFMVQQLANRRSTRVIEWDKVSESCEE